MNEVTEWLLDSLPWVQYRTRIDLIGQSEDSPEVIKARQAMLGHPQVQSLLTELTRWPGHALKRHNDATHLLHKLVFAADLGLKADDPGMNQIVKRVLEHRSSEGSFEIIANTYKSIGGSGEDQWVWMLCDTPSVLYALLKMGAENDRYLPEAVGHLAGFSRDNGWPCAVSPTMGRFRGPGRKDDPCPYATLISLKALQQVPEWRDSDACRAGAEALLTLWEQRKERRPYLFAMGTDFKKLKAPLIWYDILHVLDVLTQFPRVLKDSRLHEMVKIVEEKADQQQRFIPESVWKAWSEWGFGQKKAPSPWITLLARRILQRLENA